MFVRKKKYLDLERDYNLLRLSQIKLNIATIEFVDNISQLLEALDTPNTIARKEVRDRVSRTRSEVNTLYFELKGLMDDLVKNYEA